MGRSQILVGVGSIGVALVAGACGSGSSDSASTPSTSMTNLADRSVSGNLSFAGIWSGAERKNIQLVLNAFQKKFRV